MTIARALNLEVEAEIVIATGIGIKNSIPVLIFSVLGRESLEHAGIAKFISLAQAVVPPVHLAYCISQRFYSRHVLSFSVRMLPQHPYQMFRRQPC